MVKKIVCLFDLHVPFNINLKPIWDFISDFQPDTVVLAGDVSDWSSVNHWLSDQSRAFDGGLIKQNYEDLHKTVLNPLQESSGKRCKKIYIEGNHEYFLTKASNADPNLRGYAELQQNIDLSKYNMSIIPINMPLQVGSNLVVIHGLYTNLYHAKKTVETYRVSTLYGHVHTFQSHTLVSPISNAQFYTGQAIGCLCDLNPMYMKNRPNAWVNGFCYIHLNSDDSFHHSPIVIVRNQFRAEGKLYK